MARVFFIDNILLKLIWSPVKKGLKMNADSSKTLNTTTTAQARWIELVFYALPEMVSASVLVFLPIIVDLFLISRLKSVSSYQAFSLSSNLFYLFFKISEAIGVTTATFVGKENGANDQPQMISALKSSLFIAFLVGISAFFLVFFGSSFYLDWMSVSNELKKPTIFFLKYQAVAIFLSFVFMSFCGFFRGQKNTTLPMVAQLVSIGAFLFFDYGLLFGKFGFSEVGLQGSAYAAIARYLVGIVVLAFNFEKNFLHKLVTMPISFYKTWEMFKFCCPIFLDKSVIAVVYIWLYKLVGPLFPCALLTLEIVKNVERLAFIPAIAFSQVTNFLLSNNLGEKNISAVKNNLWLILMLTTFALTIIMAFGICFAKQIITFFDPKQLLCDEAILIFRYVSIFVIFDGIQTIFASALRTFYCSRFVMMVRALLFFGCYFPISFFVSTLSITASDKFLLIYVLFYFFIFLVGLVFLNKIKIVIKRLEEKSFC